MKNVSAFAVALMMAAPVPAAAAIVTFDGYVDESATEPKELGFNSTAFQGLSFNRISGAYVAVSNSPFGGLDGGGPFLVSNAVQFSREDCCRFNLISFDYAAATEAAVGQMVDFYLYQGGRDTIITLTLGAEFKTAYIPASGYDGASIGLGFQMTKLLALDNIRYEPVAGVPEPAAWSLMILGFGISGTAFRRRLVGDMALR